MRASHVEARPPFVLTAALLSAWALGAAPAAAQLGAPIPLLPPKPVAPPESAPPPVPAAPEPPAEGGFTAAPLAPADASWSGTLGADEGAFPQTMWQGTPRAFVAAALPLLAPTTSPTLHDLARRLLLSDAASPAGADAPDRPTLASLRLDRLMALGEVAGALGVIADLPPDRTVEETDRMRIELRFAGNDAQGACAATTDLINRYQGVWWQRALIACQALQGDGAKAALGLSLLREQKAPPDAVFETLIDALGGHPRKIDKMPDPTPLRLALLAAAKLPLPNETLAAAAPAALLAYATNDTAPAALRLAAAERAAWFGALPPDQLANLYQAIEAKPEEQTAALKPGKQPEDPRSRAIVYDVARSSAPAATRAAAIAALLEEAGKRGAFALTARLVAGPIGELRPDETDATFAGAAARALLVAGAFDAARPWIDAAHSKELTLLAGLAQQPAPNSDAALLRDGVTELMEHNGGSAPAQADLLLALLAAFGAQPGAPDWSVMLAPPHEATLPSAALWVAQEQAAAAKRIGGTVLASLLIAQAGDRLSLEPVVLSRAIAGLRAIGRDPDALALALEAAVDAGL